MSSASSYLNRASVRRFFIGGNWKCNGSLKSIDSLVSKLNQAEIPTGTDVVVAPTFLHLDLVHRSLKKNYGISAQNNSAYGNGAYTGEVSAEQLKDFGLSWVILGHSERRALFHATDDVVAKQVTLALKNGINVIACIGETLTERKENRTMDVVISQLKAIIGAVEKNWSRVVIAYEPVWAIGTGVNATPAQAQEVHNWIREHLAKAVDAEIAKTTRIIYGGSVKGNNCDELISQPDIDGFLVGGASLNGEEFISIFTSPTRSKL